MIVIVEIRGFVTTKNHVTIDHVTIVKSLTPRVTIDLKRKSVDIGGSLEVSSRTAMSITPNHNLLRWELGLAVKVSLKSVRRLGGW